MLPTHVGMDRGSAGPAALPFYAPHARGDGPTGGWPALRPASMLPTHVGMDREGPGTPGPDLSEPHARGDGPRGVSFLERVHPCSPRTWG